MRRQLGLFGALLCVGACSQKTSPLAVTPTSDGSVDVQKDAGSVVDATSVVDTKPAADAPVVAPDDGGTMVSPPPADAAVADVPADMAVPPADGDASSSDDGGVSMPWLAYNLSPATRIVLPVKSTLHGTATTVSDGGVTPVLSARLSGVNSGITFDFGKEVSGIATLKFGSASDAAQRVLLAFTESSQYIGPASDQSIGPVTLIDGALSVPVVLSGSYTMPASKLRGGFRYLSVYLATAGAIDVTGVSVNFTAAPTASVPNRYPNYFYSNDELLNRIWYAGAYTVQLNSIDPKQGRIFPYPAAGTNWDNSATVGVGNSVLVDGAKRDRTVWPGDLGIALPTAYVSTGDLPTIRSTLDTLFAGQEPTTGEFPRSGPPLNRQNGHTTSDTYHLWTLIGACNYYLYSGDKAWLDQNWVAHKKGLAFSTAKIGANRLLNVTLVSDWGRIGQGGVNIAANAILYRVLTASAEMATAENDTALAATYRSQAAALKTAANSLLWDSTVGAYRDNLTSTVYPQDGNSLAIWFGLVDTSAKAQSVLAVLRKNWNAHGAHTPEADATRATISPFPGSMEVAARLAAGDDQGALDLIRLEWGYMLNAAIGTASTFWEGYLDDGSFGYGGSYMSAAHGWSTGPTFGLTEWVLGVAPDSAAAQTYHVIPHPGDLTHVEGALTVATNKVVRVSYDRPACGDFTLRLDASTNGGSVGVVGIPKFGQTRTVQMNGATVWDGSKLVASAGVSSADEDASYIYLRGVTPTQAVFTTFPKRCP